MILCIESATGVCSVALCSPEGIVSIRESGDDRAHSKLLASYVKDILDKAGTVATQLEAVAVSRGPGSYTGLRIGVSMAKGLAYGVEIPLISIDTLLSLYNSLLLTQQEFATAGNDTLFCPMIDARRMEVFFSLIDSKGKVISSAEAAVVDGKSFCKNLDAGKIVFFGSGAAKCREVITHPNAIFVNDIHPSAAAMRAPAYEALRNSNFEDVAYFEPYYLKDFLATIPKKLLP